MEATPDRGQHSATVGGRHLDEPVSPLRDWTHGTKGSWSDGGPGLLGRVGGRVRRRLGQRRLDPDAGPGVHRDRPPCGDDPSSGTNDNGAIVHQGTVAHTRHDPCPLTNLPPGASPTPTPPPPLLIPTPSPTPPPTPAPSLTAVASATPAPGGAQGVVAAEIVAFSPSDLIEVDVGQSVALSVTILNTGTEAHRFTVTAILLHGTDGPVATLQSAMAESLMPGRRRTVQWSYTVDRPGDFFVHYLLLNGEGTLLDQAPATPQKLVVGRALPTPTATATPVASSSGQPPPTPKPTQVAAAAPTPTPTLVPIAAADAEIVGFSPASVTNVEVGQSLTVSVTVSNTGQVARQFAVGATVLNSGGTAVGDYMTTLGVCPRNNVLSDMRH